MSCGQSRARPRPWQGWGNSPGSRGRAAANDRGALETKGKCRQDQAWANQERTSGGFFGKSRTVGCEPLVIFFVFLFRFFLSFLVAACLRGPDRDVGGRARPRPPACVGFLGGVLCPACGVRSPGPLPSPCPIPCTLATKDQEGDSPRMSAIGAWVGAGSEAEHPASG